MNGTMRILAIAAFIAVSYADVSEYSEDAMKTIYSPEPGTIPARVINANIGITFEPNNLSQENSFTLMPKTDSDTAYTNTECNGYLGVELDGEKHCRLALLRVKRVKRSTEVALQIELAFELTSEPFVLVVPIFKSPITTSSRVNNAVQAPAEIEKLIVATTRPVNIGFNWLSELLEGGVTRSGIQNAVVTVAKFQVRCKPYITRPLLVSPNVADALNAIAAKII